MSTLIIPLQDKVLGRLAEAIEAAGIKKYGRNKKVAVITGYSESRISEILSGKIPLNKKFLSILCSKFSISEDFVRYGEGPMFMSQNVHAVPGALSVREIPVLGRISAGFPNIAAEEVIEHISIPGTPENSFAIVVRGASMEPTFRDGDYILFVEDADYRNNDILIVLDEWGDAMVKRLREKDGKRFLSSDNKEYPTVIPNEHYRIIGKVVKVWRDVKF